MTKTIGATEVVRNFSEILNTIKYHGSHYVIMKGGKRVAHIGPLEPSYRGPTLGDLPSLLKKGIRVGAHDLIIASTAIALGFSVATFDLRDYKKIPELIVESIREL